MNGSMQTGQQKDMLSEPGPNLDGERVIILILYITIFLAGCTGNSLILYYFGYKTKRNQLFNYYIIHLAIADFTASLITPLHFIYNIIMHDKWKMGVTMCKIVALIGPLTVNVSAWVVTSIAAERCRGITKPLKERYSRWTIRGFMLLIWLVSGLCLIPYGQSVNIIKQQCVPCWKYPIHEFAYSMVTLTVQNIIPSCMMVCIFLAIKDVVSKRSRKLTILSSAAENDRYCRDSFSVNDNTSNGLSIRSKNMKKARKERKIYAMLIIALVIFVLCLLPYNIFYSVSIYLVRVKKIYVSASHYITLIKINTWLSAIVVMNSCMNFFIYAGMDRNFKNFCRNIFCHKKYPRRETQRSRLSTIASTVSRFTGSDKGTIDSNFRTDWSNGKAHQYSSYHSVERDCIISKRFHSVDSISKRSLFNHAILSSSNNNRRSLDLVQDWQEHHIGNSISMDDFCMQEDDAIDNITNGE